MPPGVSLWSLGHGQCFSIADWKARVGTRSSSSCPLETQCFFLSNGCCSGRDTDSLDSDPECCRLFRWGRAGCSHTVLKLIKGGWPLPSVFVSGSVCQPLRSAGVARSSFGGHHLLPFLYHFSATFPELKTLPQRLALKHACVRTHTHTHTQ